MDPTFLLGLAALSIVVVAPVGEFLFRGVIQDRLRDRFGPVPAIAGASLLFGSLHLANYSGNPVAIVAVALMIALGDEVRRRLTVYLRAVDESFECYRQGGPAVRILRRAWAETCGWISWLPGRSSIVA